MNQACLSAKCERGRKTTIIRQCTQIIWRYRVNHSVALLSIHTTMPIDHTWRVLIVEPPNPWLYVLHKFTYILFDHEMTIFYDHCCRKMNKSDQTMSEHRNKILDIVITICCCCCFRHSISLSDDKMFEVCECSGADISEYSKYFPTIFRGCLRRQWGFIGTLEGWVRAYVFKGYLKNVQCFFYEKVTFGSQPLNTFFLIMFQTKA